MENQLTRLLYDHSPWRLRCLYASLYGLEKKRRRFGGDYKKWVALFSESHKWSEAELLAFQCEKLQVQVRHAYEYVPYYRELFDRLRLKPDDIQSPHDLPKLPILEKANVICEGTRMINDEFDPKKMIWHSTSGSTGTPLRVPTQRAIEQMEWAFQWTRARPGLTPEDPWSSFAGLEIIPPSQRRPPFWVDNWTSHQRMFSIFHLSDENLWFYFYALKRRHSKYIRGYPSSLYILADFMLRHGLKLEKPPDYILSRSAELQPKHKEAIEKAFACKAWDRYGLAELAASITEYECGHMHYDMDYSIIELLPVGRDDDGVVAEVIATNIHDCAWPLLRYRTGDLVVYDPDNKCEAGIPGQVIRRVYGRTGSYFTLANGTRVANITVIARECTNVRFMQVIQEDVGEIIVRIVRAPGYGTDDEQQVIHQFRRKLGPDLKTHISYVENIERTAGGKYLSIINKVNSVCD